MGAGMTWLLARIHCLLVGHMMARRSLLTFEGKPVTVDHCERCRKARVVVFER
jgi:hypothetical protein